MKLAKPLNDAFGKKVEPEAHLTRKLKFDVMSKFDCSLVQPYQCQEDSDCTVCEVK